MQIQTNSPVTHQSKWENGQYPLTGTQVSGRFDQISGTHGHAEVEVGARADVLSILGLQTSEYDPQRWVWDGTAK